MIQAPESAKRLHPASILSGGLRFIPQAVAGGAGYAAVIADRGLVEIALFGLAAAGLAMVATVLGWWRFRYTVGEGEIVIESGVLQRNRRVIPFHRVQDVALERNLLARALGTATVRIETGGASEDEGRLDMVTLQEAERLRDRVRARLGAGPAGTGASGAETRDGAPEPILFAMDGRRLLLSGLFNFSLLFLAVIFGFLNYLRDFGLVDPDAWITRENADAAASRVTFWSLASVALALLLLGMVTGVARTVARDWKFRLTRTGRGLRRRRGLFTLSEAVVPIPRVQAAMLQHGPVQRLAGYTSLSLQTLSGEGREGGSGSTDVAPFATSREAARVLASIPMPMPPADGWVRPPRLSLVRRCLPPMLLALLTGLAAWLVDVRIAWGAAALILLAVAAGISWRRHRYAVEGDILYVARGLLTRRIWILPLDRLQVLLVTAGPLQQRLALATLLVDTAGASALSQPAIVDLDAHQARHLADDLLARHKAAKIAQQHWRARQDSNLRPQA